MQKSDMLVNKKKLLESEEKISRNLIRRQN